MWGGGFEVCIGVWQVERGEKYAPQVKVIVELKSHI